MDPIIVVVIIIAVVSVFLSRSIKRVSPSKKEALVGRKAYVTKDIRPNEMGLVKFEGQIWTAGAASDDEIKVGETVKIVSVEGAKVVVTKYI